MSIAVRPAVSQDIPWLLGELAQFDQFFGAGRPLMPDVDFARERLTWMLEDHQTFLCLMAVRQSPAEPEKPMGFLFSIYNQHFFTPNILQCQSLLWWTTYEARGTTAGALLLDRWVDYARLKANWIVLVVQEKTPINVRGLERRGFKLIDQKYLLEVWDHDHLPGVPL